MPLIGLSILVQIACAIHCIRNGRNSMWLWVIIGLSLPGCLAYAVFEILPQYSGRREVRIAKAAALKKLDPEREVRSALDALQLADTAANRIALGDALVDFGSHGEAIPHFRAALGKTPGKDRATQFKLARAELESGNPAGARDQLRSLPESGSASENDRAKLLLARALDECGDKEAALALYSDVGKRLPGGEAQCRRAALLMSLDRRDEAVEELEEVERLVRRLDRFERAQQREMYDWAARTLTEIRAG